MGTGGGVCCSVRDTICPILGGLHSTIILKSEETFVASHCALAFIRRGPYPVQPTGLVQWLWQFVDSQGEPPRRLTICQPAEARPRPALSHIDCLWVGAVPAGVAVTRPFVMAFPSGSHIFGMQGCARRGRVGPFLKNSLAYIAADEPLMRLPA